MAKIDNQQAAPHLLVIIDHQEARIYHIEVQGKEPIRITPYNPHGYGRHLHSSHVWSEGKHEPERKSFNEAIARTLQGAEQVLLFGSGTGKSSAMDKLLADLRDHHRDVAEKIIGTVVVDAHHTTEDELLAKAKQFYAEFNRT